ncbi:MAG: alpha/beta hydrolase family protein [Reyranella sp.]|uniref:alpha/beta hydrolase family protein n=1 Tax=Reyranella sp. TaxID=1929291 RepID=UPI003D0F10FF
MSDKTHELVGRRALIVALAVVLASSAAHAQPFREEIVRVPAAGGASLVTTVKRSSDGARRPLAVINHGSPAEGERASLRPIYASLSAWFISRGYVVALPLRRGYGETGGDWAETYGRCAAPDYYTAGLHGASDIRATIDHMRTLSYVATDRTIVVGQSAGGWATVALSSLNPPGVPGMINFAGGRGGHQPLPGGGIGNCQPEALVKAAARYGATARVPMLWIYTRNDSFFEPALARRMVEAYVGAGGHAALKALGPFARDGHTLAGSDNGQAIWSPLLAAFLAGLR